MRPSLIVIAILFISAAAFPQVPVVSGYASNWMPAPGTYAAPFVPLVSTPSVALETGLPPQVGASNATAGNVAGATSAPLFSTSVMQATGSAAPQANAVEQNRQGGFEFGVARFENSQGVAQLVGASGKHAQTASSYTNADVDQLKQRNGTVQFEGKTERLD